MSYQGGSHVRDRLRRCPEIPRLDDEDIRLILQVASEDSQARLEQVNVCRSRNRSGLQIEMPAREVIAAELWPFLNPFHRFSDARELGEAFSQDLAGSVGFLSLSFILRQQQSGF